MSIIGENSIKFAAIHRNVPLPAKELNKHKSTITKECRKYLIGRFCECTKNNRNAEERVRDLYKRLGQGFGYTGAGIKNIVTYTRAIDHFYITEPSIAIAVLAGKSRLGYRNVNKLAKMDLSEVKKIMERLADENESVKTVFEEQKAHHEKKKKPGRPKLKFPNSQYTSVKDTPPYDPDAQITSLTYTIPPWISTVDRVFTGTDFIKISPNARSKLAKKLTELKDIAESMIEILNLQ